jgi:FkbM family methyltransferase
MVKINASEKTRGCRMAPIVLSGFLCVLIWIFTYQRYQYEHTEMLLQDGVPRSTSKVSETWDENSLWKPIDCRVFLTQVQRGESVADPNNGQLLAKYTQENAAPFWINVHNANFDQPRISVFETGVYYEKALTDIFTTILEASSPNSRVVDVGGNIGWFSMLSAALGHHVDVFEPNLVNVIRQCQSKLLNEWPSAVEDEIKGRQTKKSTINIRPLGVSDHASRANMCFNNPGMGSFVHSDEFVPFWLNITEVKDIPMITLDTMAEELDWFKSKTKIAILKVDIEGMEPPSVRGASKLLASGLVEHLLIEMTITSNNTDNLEMLSTLIETGFVVHKFGRWRGPTDAVEAELMLEPDLPKRLLEKCGKKLRQQCNFWWKHK